MTSEVGPLSAEQLETYRILARRGPRITTLLPVFARIAEGRAGRPDRLVEVDNDLMNANSCVTFAPYMRATTGTFHEHLHASIPYFLEEECRLGATLVKYGVMKSVQLGRSLRLWSFGSAEGPMARAIAAASQGNYHVLCSSENIENFSILASNAEDFVDLAVGPFYDLAHRSANAKYDVIFEHTCFQMHHPDRVAPIQIVKQKLYDDGLIFFYEKVNDSDPENYWRMEKEKDEQFKSRYFSDEEIASKREVVLTEMERCQVSLDELGAACLRLLKYAAIIWRSGNFVGIIASDSFDNLSTFTKMLPPPAVSNPKYRLYAPQPLGPTPTLGPFSGD